MDSETLNLLERLLEHFPASVYWIDTNHVFQGCNPETCRIFGVNSQQELLGKYISDILRTLKWSEKRIQEMHDLDEKIMQTKIKSETQDILAKLNEKTTFLFGLKQPICGENGEVIGLLCIGILKPELDNYHKIIES